VRRDAGSQFLHRSSDRGDTRRRFVIQLHPADASWRTIRRSVAARTLGFSGDRPPPFVRACSIRIRIRVQIQIQMKAYGSASTRSCTTHRRFAGVLACAFAAGCGTDTDSRSARITRDTIGDTIVVHAAAAGAWGDSATLVEELRIGALAGPEAYTFGRVAGLAVDSAGAIYVLDQQVPVVRVYDATGAHLRDIGREGAGPGEMRRPHGIGLLSDGRLIVRDYGNMRFDLFSAQGAVVGEWTLPGSFSTDTRFTITDDDHVYTPVIAVRHEDGGWDEGLLHFDATGAIVDTLLDPNIGYEDAQLVARSRAARTSYQLPYAPRAHWTITPGGAVVRGISDRYAIDVDRPDAPLLRLERARPAVGVAAEERADMKQTIEDLLRGTDPDWDWQGASIPSTKPHFSALTADAAGRIWVRLPGVGEPTEMELPAAIAGGPRTLRVWVEPALYDVWSPDGDLIGTVHMPDRFEPWVMRDDSVWGVLRDDDNVEYVARYRIQPG
jgi:hypothetical protein